MLFANAVSATCARVGTFVTSDGIAKFLTKHPVVSVRFRMMVPTAAATFAENCVM